MLWKKPRARFRVRFKIFILLKGGSLGPLVLVVLDPALLSLSYLPHSSSWPGAGTVWGAL